MIVLVPILLKVYRLMVGGVLAPSNKHTILNYMHGMPPMMDSAFEAGAVYACGSADVALEWLEISDLWDKAELYELEVVGPVIMNNMYDGDEHLCYTQPQVEQIALWIDEYGDDLPKVDPECCQLVVRVDQVVSYKKM